MVNGYNSSDNSRSPNQSPESESENPGSRNGGEFHGESGSGNSAAELERRTSSINALRIKAREHELKMGMLRNQNDDIIIT